MKTTLKNTLDTNKYIPTIGDAYEYIHSRFTPRLPSDAFVLLSGSISRGEGHPGSDIDLIIISDAFNEHNYLRENWKHFPVDLNITHPATAQMMMEDPDWEAMIVESSVIMGNRAAGLTFIQNAKKKWQNTERRRERAQIFLSEVTQILSLCENVEKPISQTYLFQASFLGACALCEIAGIARTGHFRHMTLVREASEKMAASYLFTEYEEYNAGKLETIEIVRDSMKVMSDFINKADNFSVDRDPLLLASTNERKMNSLHTTINFLKTNGQLVSAIFVARRYLLSLIQSLARSILKLKYDRSRLTILLLNQIWTALSPKEHIAISEAFPKGTLAKTEHWIKLIEQHL